MSRPEAPCLNCSNRHLGCHSECKLYNKFRADNELFKNKLHKEQYQTAEWLEYKNYKYRNLGR